MIASLFLFRFINGKRLGRVLRMAPEKREAFAAACGVDYKRARITILVGVGAAGMAAGCAQPPAEKLIPYLVAPNDNLPGIPYYYASTCRECPAGCGVLVKAREGRAIKIEGNPQHPMNLGTLCARGQAGLQGLYDPDRLKAPRVKENGAWKDVTWEAALALAGEKVQASKGRTALLTGHETGSMLALAREFAAATGGLHLGLRAVRLREPARGEPPHLRAGRDSARGLREGPHDRVVRRRLPRDLGLARRERARLRRGPHARQHGARGHGRAAAVADRRQCRRMGGDPAGRRDGAGAGPRPRDDQGRARAPGREPVRAGERLDARTRCRRRPTCRPRWCGTWRTTWPRPAPASRSRAASPRRASRVSRCWPRSTCSTTSPATSASRCASTAP